MADWYVSKSGKTHGPFSSKQLIQLAVESKINPTTEVRMGTDGRWTTADKVKGLFTGSAGAATATATATAPAPGPPPLPVARQVVQPVSAPAPVNRDSTVGEEEMLRVHPSMFRNHPIRFCLLCLSPIVPIVAGVFAGAPGLLTGLLWVVVAGLYFLIWWLRNMKISLTVTNKRTTLRFGLLSRYLKEVRHSDVRTLIVEQSLLQRLLGVGYLAVASAASNETDIRISGIPDPEKIKELIDKLRP